MLGAILEQATGQAYADLLQERILDPVEMNNTGYDVSEEILPHRAAGYAKTLQGFRNAEYIDMSVPYAAGSMYSTVEDLYLWDRALRDGELLGESLSKAMFTPGMGDYAYGWFVANKPIGPDSAERQVTLHSGGINGGNQTKLADVR